MSVLLRPFLLLVVVFAGLAAIPRGAAFASHNVKDQHVLGVASLRLGHQRFDHVLSWLRHQPTVRSALRGKDGRTLDVQFRDGFHAAILPAAVTRVRVPLSLFHRNIQALSQNRSPANAGSGQALVLEPFAAQLGLGPNAGDPEVQYLQSAGYQVNQVYDTAVTVNFMKALSQYNVVYMQTHAGVANGGEGIVATGEQANGDPAVAPYIRNGTVITVLVSGSTIPYYAITSSFITTYEGQFPANSLLFFNGCDLLSSSRFWSALSANGAGVMVSWNLEATSTANYVAGVEFFKYLSVPGTTVAAAIADVRAAGFGTSAVNGQTAVLGYLGNGAVTLQSAAGSPVSTPLPTPTATATATALPAGATPTPTSVVPTETPEVINAVGTSAPVATSAPTATGAPVVTGTPVPTATAGVTSPLATATATATAGATATATRTPVHHVLSVALKSAVAPGSWQHITLRAAPNTVVQIRVGYPNGDHQFAKRKTGKNGTAVYAYKQGASKIAHGNTVAVVTMTTKAGAKVSRSYRISFGRLDVSVQPRAQWPGRKVTIWVHATARTRVAVTLLFPNRTYALMYRKTGSAGWASLVYQVAKHKTVGKNHNVRVVARTKSKAPNYSTKTILTIR